MQNERNYGIDLLRLLLMFMVCILHVLGYGGVLKECDEGTTNYYVFWFIEICAYCAVDAFALISGYTAKDKPVNYPKLIDMWFQAVFYSFVMALIFNAFGKYELVPSEVVRLLMPVTHDVFWYFTAYVGLFIFTPILNRFIFSVSEDSARKIFVALILIFSCVGLLEDAFKLNYGYSVFWLVILYCLGALANKIHLFKEKKTVTLLVLLFLSTLITWYTQKVLGYGLLLEYTSPTIVLNGMLLVVLFSRIKIKGGIAEISKYAFGIYLCHVNPAFGSTFLQKKFGYIAEYGAFEGSMTVLGIALSVFLTGLIVEMIRHKIASVIRLHSLSEKIVRIIECCINKVSILLR